MYRMSKNNFNPFFVICLKHLDSLSWWLGRKNVQVVIYHEKKNTTFILKESCQSWVAEYHFVSLPIWLQSFRSTWWVEFITTLCWSIILCKASQRGLPLHQLRWYSYPSSGRGQATWSTMDSSTATRQRRPTRLWRYVTKTCAYIFIAFLYVGELNNLFGGHVEDSHFSGDCVNHCFQFITREWSWTTVKLLAVDLTPDHFRAAYGGSWGTSFFSGFLCCSVLAEVSELTLPKETSSSTGWLFLKTFGVLWRTCNC